MIGLKVIHCFHKLHALLRPNAADFITEIVESPNALRNLVLMLSLRGLSFLFECNPRRRW